MQDDLCVRLQLELLNYFMFDGKLLFIVCLFEKQEVEYQYNHKVIVHNSCKTQL